MGAVWAVPWLLLPALKGPLTHANLSSTGLRLRTGGSPRILTLQYSQTPHHQCQLCRRLGCGSGPRAHPAGTFLRFPRQWQEPGLLPGSHAQLFSSQPVLQSPLPLQWNSAEHLCLGQHIQGDTSTCRVAQALVQEETVPGWS